VGPRRATTGAGRLPSIVLATSGRGHCPRLCSPLHVRDKRDRLAAGDQNFTPYRARNVEFFDGELRRSGCLAEEDSWYVDELREEGRIWDKGESAIQTNHSKRRRDALVPHE